MKKILFPLQKLAILFFFLELLIGLDKITYIVISTVLLGLSLMLQGARPYTPLLFFVIIFQIFNFTIVQVVTIILAGIAGAILNLYEINSHIKGPFLMGHRYQDIQLNGKKLLVSIFYPTLTKTKKPQWIPKQRDYNKVLYQIFHVDPKTRKIPYQIFTFVNSYIHKIRMPAQEMSPFITQPQIQALQNTYKDNLQKIIIFSHGLGSHLNAYSSLFESWVSQGYTVISINHDNDVVCLDHRTITKDQNIPAIKQFLFKNRNRDLKIRINQVISVISLVQGQNFMKECLESNRQIKYKQIIMAGHSFGAATALAVKAYLNKKFNHQPQQLQKFTKLICLDPWLFPFQQSMFDNLKHENILIINSQYFYKEIHQLYDIQKLYGILIQNNPNISAYMITRMDHIAQCDLSYVFGNILQKTGSIKLFKLTDKFMALNIFICALFLEGKTKQQIIQNARKFIQDKNMHLEKVQMLEEYRVTRQLTFRKRQVNEEYHGKE